MLVLTRMIGESIEIHTDPPVTVTLVDVRGTNKARIGIQAPPEIAVHRAEVAQEIRREQAALDTEQ